MPGQAIVAIRDKQWVCSVASTYAELTSGLSGVESIPPQTGVLFDLGYDQKYIAINMSQMLFPLDIVFINSTQGVVGAIHNVQPGLNATLHNERLPGARCFLEVNAGEAQGIGVGDNVDVQGYAQPVNPAGWIAIAGVAVAIGGMAAVVSKVLGAPKKQPSGQRLLPRTGSKIAEKPRLPQTTSDYDKELEQLKRDLREGAISPENYMRAVKEILARKHKPVTRLPQTEIASEKGKYVKIIAPGQTSLTIGSIVTREELQQENKRARERREQPATAEVWEGGKPVMIRPKVIPTEKTKVQPDKLEYLADSPEFLAQTIEGIGYREKLDTTFKQAIARAKGLK